MMVLDWTRVGYIVEIFLLKRGSFLTYDTADDIITSLEIIEKLLIPETDFWHDNYLNHSG